MAELSSVDLALVLAVDGSASVTYEEFGLIAGGMAAAFRDPAIIAGLIGGPAKASRCSLLLWSGSGAQEVITDWTLIASEEDARSFADSVGLASCLMRAFNASTYAGRSPRTPGRRAART